MADIRYAAALFEGPEFVCTRTNEEWRQEFGECEGRSYGDAPMLGSLMSQVYRTGVDRWVPYLDAQWMRIAPRKDGRGVSVAFSLRAAPRRVADGDTSPATPSDLESRELVDDDDMLAPIPLSSEEETALYALRLLVERGVIGPR